MKAYVELAPGCHGKPFSPTVSEHRTLRAALDRARKSDRLVAVDADTGERWMLPQQNDPRYGSGRFGNGVSPREARALGWPL